jgi:hypothetical protein
MDYGSILLLAAIAIAAEKRHNDLEDAEAEAEAKKERLAAEVAQAERAAGIKLQQAAAAETYAASIDSNINIRQQTHTNEVARLSELVSDVDKYRAQAGLTGDQYDETLSRLYAAERSVALETQQNALANEEIELEMAQAGESNLGKIALYSVLGIAAVGSLVYIKKRQLI